MKKSFRIICLVLAIAFAASMLVSIICSIALADGMDTRGEILRSPRPDSTRPRLRP